MSIQSVLTRIQQLDAAFLTPAATPASSAQPAAGSQAGAAAGGFSSLLAQAGTDGTGATAAAASVAPAGGTVAQRIVAAAEGEVGQSEQPPGSNDSPRIAQYRTATQGAAAGEPWCSYFASWVARQAGVPVGNQGQGFGAVDDLWAWAQSSGKAVPQGQPPKAGDLVVFNEHIGVVESVLPDGRIQTIEGNYADKVSRNVRPPTDAIGYVRLG